MNRCEHCERAAGLYVFGRNCCRVRYLLALPPGRRHRDTRCWWLDRWASDYGQAAADETQDAVAAAWEARRAALRDAIAGRAK